MKFKINACNIWEQGPRPKQEDSIYPEYGKIDEGERLFILCDGMGGHSAGEVASRTVCDVMSDTIKKMCPDAEGPFSDHDFIEALEMAYDVLDTKDNGAEKKMGTTLTFLKLHDKGATIAHIGDSRVYHIRPGKGGDDTEILFQTIDHSLVNDLIKIGELTPEEAKFSKQRNVITRAMQPLMERRSKADIYHTKDIKTGDYFMLCSDGILEQMEDANIQYIFSEKGGDIMKKIEMLKKVTAQNHDNHSAILVEIKEVVMAVANDEEQQPVVAKVGEEKKNEAEMPNAVMKRKPTSRVNKKNKPDNLGLKVIVALLVFIALFFVYKKYFGGDEEKDNQGKTSVESVRPSKQRTNKPVNSTPDKTEVSSSSQSSINQQPDNQAAEQPTSNQQSVEQGGTTTAASSPSTTPQSGEQQQTTGNPGANVVNGIMEKINGINSETVPSSDQQAIQEVVNSGK